MMVHQSPPLLLDNQNQGMKMRQLLKSNPHCFLLIIKPTLCSSDFNSKYHIRNCGVSNKILNHEIFKSLILILKCQFGRPNSGA